MTLHTLTWNNEINFLLNFCEGHTRDITWYTLTGDEENTQDDEEQLPVATNSANQVKFKSVSVSDRGMRFVPIHLIKHQTAPLITEEMIQEQKILRQKYLSKKVSQVTYPSSYNNICVGYQWRIHMKVAEFPKLALLHGILLSLLI